MTPSSAQFTAVMRAPLVRSIDGQDVTFPLLTAAELGELGEVIRNEWWEALKKNPQYTSFKPIEQFRARQEIDEAVLTIVEIIKRVVTIGGAAWCVERSLTKQGYDDSQRAAILEQLTPMDLKDIAELVSRIRQLPKAKPAPGEEDALNRPLPVAGAEAPPPAPTGEPLTSNSDSTASTSPT